MKTILLIDQKMAQKLYIPVINNDYILKTFVLLE